MFTKFKISFRRLLAVCLVATILFFTSAIATGSNQAMAEVLKRDAVGMTKEAPLDEAEYESVKANRNQLQAERSQKAEAKANRKAESESITEKLNLDEINPPGLDDILNP